MTRALGVIVEGHGEVDAAPVLIRRVLAQIGVFDVTILRPHRVPRSKIGKGEWGRAIRLQYNKAAEVSDAGPFILALLDADDDDPGDLRGQVLDEASELDVDSSFIGVVVAVREYEAWFLASLETLAGHRAVKDSASHDGDPDGPRNAKKVLEQNMLESYSETLHQAAFSEYVDIELAATRSAFASLVEVLEGYYTDDDEDQGADGGRNAIQSPP